MTVTMMEIRDRGGAGEPILGLDRPTREALAIYCARNWPTNRRKSVETAFRLTPDEARGVIQGTASTTTLDKVWKAGGWAVVLPILGAVIGHGVGEFFAAEADRARREADDARQQAEALASAERVALRSFAPCLGPRMAPLGDRMAFLRAGNGAASLGVTDDDASPNQDLAEPRSFQIDPARAVRARDRR